ncbi:XrtA system polysaccharide deacetylase [Geobacter sp.]|uniref:XrtA system polysaccharide deacetylase n=1 Tax=Geobacter sp. TaxID=46610 RepID=UPI002623F7B5|nr:XrtA system polysaccharide deacetylase [Geobacter sp.]
MVNALTIDVEDYFHVTAFERSVARDDWDKYSLRVEGNTEKVLDILEKKKIRATFFILGWVAERCPGLVREIGRRGHEIACHGYAHELIYRIGPERFRDDVRRAKALLEDTSGARVFGYRAPSYSITARSLWALDILVEEGFFYDSSIFPISHDIYGIPGGERFPHEIETQAGMIREFPMTTFPLRIGWWNPRLPVAGGGYLRLFPALLVGRAIKYINSHERQPAVVYFHPWEMDPGQPRIRAGLKSRFRHYLNLAKMEAKIDYLLEMLRFAPIRDIVGPGRDTN